MAGLSAPPFSFFACFNKALISFFSLSESAVEALRLRFDEGLVDDAEVDFESQQGYIPRPLGRE